MGIASHLSWANFFTVQATLFPNLIPFFLFFFAVQWYNEVGYMKIVVDGTTVPYIEDRDFSHGE